MKTLHRILALITACVIVSGCNTYGTDNTPKPTPLQTIHNTVDVTKVWSTSAGTGVGKKFIKLSPAYQNNRLFIADNLGTITSLDPNTGRRGWHVKTTLPITGGPTADAGMIFVGTSTAEVAAFDQTDGAQRWKTRVPSEVLAAPTASNGTLLIKTIDGQLTALNEVTGEVLWHYQEDVPSLILRGSSPVVTNNDTAVAGFANGKLVSLDINTGNLLWKKAIATPEQGNVIANMVDIDATPMIQDNTLYAATYQGNIAALNLQSGQTLWQHDISTYAGITASSSHVYVSETDSRVFAFDSNSGAVAWKQTELLYRNLTGPVLLENTLVVGDTEGYLHFLSAADGTINARVKVSGKSILATPLVINNTLYVATTDGNVAAYRIKNS